MPNHAANGIAALAWQTSQDIAAAYRTVTCCSRIAIDAADKSSQKRVSGDVTCGCNL